MTDGADDHAMRAMRQSLAILGAAALAAAVPACTAEPHAPPAPKSALPAPPEPAPQQPQVPAPPDPPPVATPKTPPNPDLPGDAAARRRFIRDHKLVTGWKSADSEHFIYLHSAAVSPELMTKIRESAEAMRGVLQARFPLDAAASRVLIVRVCKDRDQYMGYGAPPGTSGHADLDSEEIVVFEDVNERASALRNVQSLVCATHLAMTLGTRAGHPWFRAGFEGWAAAHSMEGGRFAVHWRTWRPGGAFGLKSAADAPRLADVLAWDDRRPAPARTTVSDQDLRALATDLVAFLVASDQPELRAIPARYYAALVRGAAEEAALTEATQGVDLAALERAWRAD